MSLIRPGSRVPLEPLLPLGGRSYAGAGRRAYVPGGYVAVTRRRARREAAGEAAARQAAISRRRLARRGRRPRGRSD
ncbi:hypothetical protein EVAR_49122_1 [Eumeta japonica]|uniref:Uncharacterized protein n=1 Tax=Eumeta variegata TaxID=151549 RepID=A0A4C1YP97_EUMVA|nr:hypothetical protein EVAR_49122_1 [Eumeta japonica]